MTRPGPPLQSVDATPIGQWAHVLESPSVAIDDMESGLDQMSVAIVIPTWRRAAWLDRALGAVALQDRLPQEIIVVGRHEDQAAQVVCEKWQHTLLMLRWIVVERPGHVAPIVCGLKAVTQEIVVVIDDDVQPEPAWLKALIGPLLGSSVACVGGRVIDPAWQGVVAHDAGRLRWYGQYAANVGALESAAAIPVDSAMEGNWAWRLSVLRSLEFDPTLDFDDASMYGLDLCLQARRRGFTVIYQPKARVLHALAPRDASLSREDRSPRDYAYSRNYTYILLKHLNPWRRVVFLAWWFVIGSRGSYGLVTALVDSWRDWPKVRGRLGPAFRGKVEGWRLWCGRAAHGSY